MFILNSKVIIPVQNIKSYLPLQWSYTCFHISSVVKNVQKQSKIMTKMLQHERKRKWYDNASSFVPSAKALNSRNTGKKSLRRVAVLNKLFMKNITDLLSMGGIASDILGRGLEISKVNISNDFNTVNVYWVSRNEKHDNNLEAVLNRVAGALRHELSQLRVMGEVPKICFVKDLYEFQIIQLDKRLEKADFGEDYVPKKFNAMKSNFTLEMKLSPAEKESIKQLEDSSEDNIEVEETLPPMTHTVFNLDHQTMMNRLVAACNKSRKAWRGQVDTQFQDAATNTTFQRQAQLPIREQNQDLSDFLKKRQILIDKMHKDLTKRDSTNFVYEEDYGDENCDSLLENYEFDDYIDEDLNESNDNEKIFKK